MDEFIGKILNPKVFGPGKWDDLNVLAVYFGQIGPKGDKVFCFLARLLIGTLPCYTCTEHATKFVNDRPPENFIGMKVPKYGSKFAMLFWVVSLHNNANDITGKRKVSMDEIVPMILKRVEEYTQKIGTGCSGGCLEFMTEKDNIKENTIPNQSTSLVYDPRSARIPQTKSDFVLLSKRS
jgi:hypothetical protein